MLSNSFDERERFREFVMSLQVMIYAKQNGAQMATFAATGSRADIDDLRKTMAALGTRLGFVLTNWKCRFNYDVALASLK